MGHQHRQGWPVADAGDEAPEFRITPSGVLGMMKGPPAQAASRSRGLGLGEPIHGCQGFAAGGGDRFAGDAFDEDHVAGFSHGSGEGLVGVGFAGALEEHVEADDPCAPPGQSFDEPGVQAAGPAPGRSDCPRARAERESSVTPTTAGGAGRVPLR